MRRRAAAAASSLCHRRAYRRHVGADDDMACQLGQSSGHEANYAATLRGPRHAPLGRRRSPLAPAAGDAKFRPDEAHRDGNSFGRSGTHSKKSYRPIKRSRFEFQGDDAVESRPASRISARRPACRRSAPSKSASRAYTPGQHARHPIFIL